VHTRLPDGSEAYIFGSSLHSAKPSDVDLLIVYDPSKHNPVNAHGLFTSIGEWMAELTGRTVDLTLLTISEERESNFIDDTGAIALTGTTGRRIIDRLARTSD